MSDPPPKMASNAPFSWSGMTQIHGNFLAQEKSCPWLGFKFDIWPPRRATESLTLTMLSSGIRILGSDGQERMIGVAF